jgi:hypothetical protein
MTDNLPAATTDTTTDTFVRVYFDPDTGRTIVALGPAAADALTQILDTVYTGDVRANDDGQYDNPDQTADVLANLQKQLGSYIHPGR